MNYNNGQRLCLVGCMCSCKCGIVWLFFFVGVCKKLLECTLHRCSLKCHEGACPPCSETLKQECFCGKVGRKIRCSSEFKGITKYSCGEVCEKELLCGNHKCSKICHDGDCELCANAPEQVKYCPCGKMKLEEGIRSSCCDPIPCCDEVRISIFTN